MKQRCLTWFCVCEFADGRFQAAQFIYSKDALEKIKNVMRNTDKRVVKLMDSDWT